MSNEAPAITNFATALDCASQPWGNSSHRARIMRVPGLLSWKGDSDVLRDVRGKYLRMLREAFEIWLSGADCADRRGRYESLGPGGQERVLTAPKVGYGLLHQSSVDPCDFRRSVDESLNRESGKRGPDREEPDRRWHVSSGDSFCGSLPMLAKLTAHTDGEPDGELVYVHERLDRCVRKIQAISPPASALIQQVLRVVVARKNPDDPRGFSSSSWPGWIGLIAVTNGHRRDLDDAWIADSMVHECIHSFLYMVESFEPFYPSVEASQAWTAESPWSGKMLYLHSYVHACFVWFGLWNFWNQAGGCALFTAPTVEFFRQRSRSGFGPDTLERLGEGINFISNPVRQAITAMQQRVMRS